MPSWILLHFLFCWFLPLTTTHQTRLTTSHFKLNRFMDFARVFGLFDFHQWQMQAKLSKLYSTGICFGINIKINQTKKATAPCGDKQRASCRFDDGSRYCLENSKSKQDHTGIIWWWTTDRELKDEGMTWHETQNNAVNRVEIRFFYALCSHSRIKIK